MQISIKVVLTAIGLIVLAIVLWIIPHLQSEVYRAKFTPEDIQKLDPKDRITLEKSASDVENNARVTLAQILGGLALLSGLYFTYQNVKAAQDNARTAQENIKLTQENLRITEEGKLTDRFSKAVELLGSEKLDIRLGGIYALERIARDSQKDHWTVMEVLTAFVREHSYKKVERKKTVELSLSNAPVNKSREDIQAIMTVIGRRKWIQTETIRLDLQQVNLTGITLFDVNLSKANLSKANLSGITLIKANLSGVNLTDANLMNAMLIETDLSESYLHRANLKGANTLGGINIQGAELVNTNLEDSVFITLEQVLSTKYCFGSRFSPELTTELIKWQARQSSEKADADSGKKQAKD